tara:strand:+ start:202 stop:372 length:171 start_codon:yes stop_codon:yes gene_type:complete
VALSFKHFDKILKVPFKFVSKTLFASRFDFCDFSTDGSAQQSITISKIFFILIMEL